MAVQIPLSLEELVGDFAFTRPQEGWYTTIPSICFRDRNQGRLRLDMDQQWSGSDEDEDADEEKYYELFELFGNYAENELKTIISQLSKINEVFALAISFGYLELLKILYSRNDRGYTITDRDWFVAPGYYIGVGPNRVLVRMSSESTVLPIDLAARHGRLEVVKFLHSNGVGCTTLAMDYAARNGYLEVVKWLHSNREEGCTTYAMNGAAGMGYIEVVKWLHYNRGEGCTTHAMDYAAKNGHLEVVKFLHFNRGEGCTPQALEWAAAMGYLEVVKFLYSHRRNEGCISCAIIQAAGNGYLEVVKLLNDNCDKFTIDRAITIADYRDRHKVVEWLRANPKSNETSLLEECLSCARYRNEVPSFISLKTAALKRMY